MKYEIKGVKYSLRQLNNILSGRTKKYKGDCELQEAALEIMESIAEEG